MKLAIIPARSGSKRIKNKNIKNFFGKPIIYWSIKLAIETNLFDKIIVSTDSHKIAKLSRSYGAETPFIRPKNLSNDYVNTNEVIKHSIKWFKSKKIDFDYVCCIYPTAPFLTKKNIKKGLKLLTTKKKLFSFTVTSFPHPIERALSVKKNGEVIPLSKKNEIKRSQEFNIFYHDIGQMYWGRSDAFLENKKIFSKNSVAIQVPRYLSHDINTIDEWKNAEMVFKSLKINKLI